MSSTERQARSTALPSPRYKWAVVGMLWFICFFNYADRQAISAIFPLLERDFGFDKQQLGLIGAAFTWVYALSAPFAGPVGDRYSRKVVILAGLYAWSAITGLTALCSKVWHFVLVRGAEGLGETFYFPASMSLVSDYHSKATRSRAMSLHQTSVYAGTIGGSAFAGWMGARYGWQWPFILLGVAGILLGLVLAAFIREPQRNEAERLERGESVTSMARAQSEIRQESNPPPMPWGRFLREMVRTPTALILVAAFFGANFVALVFLTWMPTFLKEKFGLRLAMAGLEATIYIQIASMVGAMFSGTLADRWRQQRAGGRIQAQAVGALLGAPFIFLCGYTTDRWVLVGAMTAFGLCKGVYDANIWASLYDVIPPSRRASAVGLMNMIGWLGGGLGAFAIGAVVHHGMTMSAAISATATIYLAVAALLLLGGLVLAPRDVQRAQQALQN